MAGLSACRQAWPLTYEQLRRRCFYARVRETTRASNGNRSSLNLRSTRDYVDPPTGQVPDEVAADCDPDACSGQAASALAAVAF